MKDFVLSKRMEAVVNLVSPQSLPVADIGCDHAYVSIMLIKRRIAGKVVAMDVRKGPLETARKNIESQGLEEVIELRLSDGLNALKPGEAGEIVIAGMGGLLMKRILEEGKEVLSFVKGPPALVLQPQSDIREVRIFLYGHAYHIVQEQMLVEEGKYYTVIRAVPGEVHGCFSDAEWVYGKYNLEKKCAVLYEYLHKERRTLDEVCRSLEEAVEQAAGRAPEKTLKRLSELKGKLTVNQCAMEYYVN